MRVNEGGHAGTRGCRGGRGLVFAVLAGWQRIRSPSATANGSPNRLLCLDPVRPGDRVRPSFPLSIVKRVGLGACVKYGALQATVGGFY
jgi:hypothetical protein